MTSRGTGRDIRPPRSGQYTIRVGVYGDQAGDEPVVEALDRHTSRGVIDVPSTRSDPGVHEHVVELPSARPRCDLSSSTTTTGLIRIHRNVTEMRPCSG